MSIAAKCDMCGIELEVDDGLAGQVAQCPKCSQDFLVPARTTGSVRVAVRSSARSVASHDSPTGQRTKPLRIVLMAIGAGMLLVCALSFMNSDIVQISPATIFAGIGGIVLLILAAIAK